MALLQAKTPKNPTTAKTIYRYVIDHDMGFSPNPFHGYCTLANCKPVIRRCAHIGDLVLGFGSSNSGQSGHLIYWMKIEEILTYDQYWLDDRFQIKKPVVNGSHLKFHGDNIYHSHPDGGFHQEHSFHSLPDGRVNPKNLHTDTGSTDRVLVSTIFGYYGEAAMKVPGELEAIIPRGRGHRTACEGNLKDHVESWLINETPRGFLKEPSGWKYIK